MKKILTMLAFLAVVDLFTPAIHTGAQAAIAPLILALIGAVGSMAASQQKKQGDMASASAAAAGGGGGGGGIDMSPEGIKFSPNSGRPSADEARLSVANNAPPAAGAESLNQDNQMLLNQVMSGFSQDPASKHQAAVEAVNANPSSQYPLSPEEAGKFGTGELLSPDFGKTPVNQPEEGGDGFFGDMSAADKVAMASSIGSLFRGPGPPRPPSVGGGGGRGIDMQPVFLNTIYGRRR